MDYDGEYYTVSVDILNPKDIYAIQFALTFDENNVSCIDVQPGEKLSSISEPTINSSIPGKIYFIWESLDIIKEDLQLMTIVVKANDDEIIGFDDDLILLDGNMEEIEGICTGCVTTFSSDNSSIIQSENISSSNNILKILLTLIIIAFLPLILIIVLKKTRRNENENI